jgi:hypothetical protein
MSYQLPSRDLSVVFGVNVTNYFRTSKRAPRPSAYLATRSPSSPPAAAHVLSPHDGTAASDSKIFA